MKKTYFLWALLSLFLLSSPALTSCSDDDEEPRESASATMQTLLGTWMTAGGEWGYSFMDEGECICYDNGERWPGTYGIRNGILYIYWAGEPEPEIYIAPQIKDNILILTDEYEERSILYREGSRRNHWENDNNIPGHGDNEGSGNSEPNKA